MSGFSLIESDMHLHSDIAGLAIVGPIIAQKVHPNAAVII